MSIKRKETDEFEQDKKDWKQKEKEKEKWKEARFFSSKNSLIFYRRDVRSFAFKRPLPYRT